jgi:replicative DNA helicase Mcm
LVIDANEQIEKFQDFLEQTYKKELHKLVTQGRRSVAIDFFELTRFDPDLAEQLLDEPEETIKAAELAIEQLDLGTPLRARFTNFPESQTIFIRNIRAHHLGKFIAVQGIIRQSSDVRPEVVSAKFECPSCGNTITLLQTESKFREPSRCTCGRRGRFRLLAKELVDAQRIVLEEPPQSLEGGAQPKRISVFLREDLVEPRMEKKTTPGSNVCVTGTLKEIPVPHRDGGVSTRFDIVMDANHIEPVEEDYSDVEISTEDEKMIKEMAKDKSIFERLKKSIAPSIFGHDRIKEAIVLQISICCLLVTLVVESAAIPIQRLLWKMEKI